MNNKAMERKLQTGECIDVSDCRRTERGDYILAGFREDIDYADAKTEEWIFSIGRVMRVYPVTFEDKSTGMIEPGTYLASTDARHYSAGDSDFVECLWLR